MKKIILLSLVFLASCSWKAPKVMNVENGMGDKVDVKITLSENLNSIGGDSFNRIISKVENNPCKHKGSYEPKSIFIYMRNDTIVSTLECMCSNAYGVYGKVNSITRLDKNYNEIDNFSF